MIMLNVDPYYLLVHKYYFSLRGQGGPRSIFTFLLFLIKGNASYQKLFSERKNIVPRQSYRILKSIFYRFRGRPLKLGSYVLGTKTKFLSQKNFDIGLRSENIKF